MSEEHRDAWPKVLCGWVQKVLDDFDGGATNACYPFVRSETIRCFGDRLALHVPGA